MAKLEKIMGEKEFEEKLEKFESILLYGYPISDLDEDELKVALVMAIENYESTMRQMGNTIDFMQFLNEQKSKL